MINLSNLQITPPIPWHITHAEKMLWELSGPCGSERKWRAGIFSRLPDRLAVSLAKQYETDWTAKGRFEANSRLRIATKPFLDSGLPLSADEDDLRRLAKLKANMACRVARNFSNQVVCLIHLSSYAKNSGIEPPVPGGRITLKGAIKRLQDERWWRRALRKAQMQGVEAGAIHAGLVHARSYVYVSDENVLRRRQQNQRIRNILEALKAVNELGDTYSLQELSDLSISNPVLRRNELMTRLAGYELYGEQEGYEAVFVTLTCPSRFHARYGRSGDPNPSYDGSTPKQAQAYLNGVWTRVRSRWNYRGVDVYGIRIAEPHHDGTPHWHLLLFLKVRDKEECLNLFKEYSLKESPDEPGAQERRFKVEEIDKSKGTAIGYVAKYISKNVDGFGLDCDEFGGDPATSAERVKAWSSTWGIRQFQDFGGPPVTVWRELRRVRSEIPDTEVLESARDAADHGDWAAFVRVMGGVCRRRSDRPIGLVKKWSDKLNSYDEPIGEIVFGVAAGGVSICTRIHVWRITAESKALTDSYRVAENTKGERRFDPIGSEDAIGSNFPDSFGGACSYLEFCQ